MLEPGTSWTRGGNSDHYRQTFDVETFLNIIGLSSQQGQKMFPLPPRPNLLQPLGILCNGTEVKVAEAWSCCSPPSSSDIQHACSYIAIRLLLQNVEKISHFSPVSDVTVDCTASRNKKLSPPLFVDFEAHLLPDAVGIGGWFFGDKTAESRSWNLNSSLNSVRRFKMHWTLLQAPSGFLIMLHGEKGLLEDLWMKQIQFQ